MALAQNPKVLLLDEPFAGCRSRSGATCRSLLAAIPRDVTIVMIEHDMDVALEFAERITVLHFGEVIVEGTRAEVVAHPAPGRSILATDALPLDDIDAFYGDSHVLHRRFVHLRRGPSARPARPQRRRQDHLHERGGRASCRHGAARVAVYGTRGHRTAARSDRRPAASPWCRRAGASSAASRCARTSPSRRASRGTARRAVDLRRACSTPSRG